MPTTPSPAACSVPEPVTAPQDAILISTVRDGVVQFCFATTAGALPAPIAADAGVLSLFTLEAFDDAARLVIAEFLDRGWFTLADVLAHVQVLPVHGGGRAARRRGDA